MEYVTIYNIEDWMTFIEPITFSIITIIVFAIVYYFMRNSNKISKYTFLFIIFITMSGDIIFYIKMLDMKDMYKNNRYKIVEGVVENFVPYIEKKQSESFSVKGVKFQFSKDEINGGFHEVGKVYNGLKVKIYYTEKYNNIILRLDRER